MADRVLVPNRPHGGKTGHVTIAGSGPAPVGSGGRLWTPDVEGGIARDTWFSPDVQIAPAPDGSVYVAEGWQISSFGWLTAGNRVRRIASYLPEFTADDLAIASEDGTQLFGFDPNGRHRRTVDALTGAILYTFEYDAAGRVSAVVDGDGNRTTVERDAFGRPTAILAPHGQRTALALDGNGYLANVTNPAGESIDLGYYAEGLLGALTDGRGNTYTFEYDPAGRLTRDAAPGPGGGHIELSRSVYIKGQGEVREPDVVRSTTVTAKTAEGTTRTYRTDELSSGAYRLVNTGADGKQTQILRNPDASETVTDPDGTVTTLATRPDPRFGIAAPLYGATVATPGGKKTEVITTRAVTLANRLDPLSLTAYAETLTVNGGAHTRVYNPATRTFTDTTPQGRTGVA